MKASDQTKRMVTSTDALLPGRGKFCDALKRYVCKSSVGGLEFAVGCVSWVGGVVKAAVGQGTAETLVRLARSCIT
jgi:hypothetical protein